MIYLNGHVILVTIACKLKTIKLTNFLILTLKSNLHDFVTSSPTRKGKNNFTYGISIPSKNYVYNQRNNSYAELLTNK